MLKQSLLICSLLGAAGLVCGTLMTSQAEASRARLISLGQAGMPTETASPAVSPAGTSLTNLALGYQGSSSLSIDDPRNVFLNPAQLHRYAPFANFELGLTTPSATNAGPAAEGGLMLSRGDLKYGIQLGRETTAAPLINGVNDLLGLTTAGTMIPHPTNGAELLVAGGGPMKWGASLLYASSENKTDSPTATARFPNRKANTLEARGGIVQDKLSAYGKLLLIASAENEVTQSSPNKFDAKPGIEFGGNFDMNADQRLWGLLGYYSGTAKMTSASSNDRDFSYTFLTGGFTQFWNPEAITRLFFSGGLTYSMANLKGTSTIGEVKRDRIAFPIVIGVENQATDWMMMRASVRQNVLFDQSKYSDTTDFNYPNTTVVSAGPGFKWKKLTADAVLGGAVNQTATFNGTDMFANLGMTYMF